MMVEAGGTERLLEVLRRRRSEGHRRGPGGRASRRPRPGSASRSSCSASSVGQGGQVSRPFAYELFTRLRRRRLRAGCRRSVTTRRQGQHDHRQGRAQRRNRRGDDADHRRALPRNSTTVRTRDQGGGPFPDQDDRPQADRRRGHPHRRPRACRHPAAHRPKSACSRPRTARASSSGARPRCSTSRRSGMPRMNQTPRHDRDRRLEALHAPLQLPALLDR